MSENYALVRRHPLGGFAAVDVVGGEVPEVSESAPSFENINKAYMSKSATPRIEIDPECLAHLNTGDSEPVSKRPLKYKKEVPEEVKNHVLSDAGRQLAEEEADLMLALTGAVGKQFSEHLTPDADRRDGIPSQEEMEAAVREEMVEIFIQKYAAKEVADLKLAEAKDTDPFTRESMKDSYGADVEVFWSSAAMAPHLWVNIEGGGTVSELTKVGEGTSHLSLNQAKWLRTKLNQWINDAEAEES